MHSVYTVFTMPYLPLAPLRMALVPAPVLPFPPRRISLPVACGGVCTCFYNLLIMSGIYYIVTAVYSHALRLYIVMSGEYIMCRVKSI